MSRSAPEADFGSGVPVLLRATARADRPTWTGRGGIGARSAVGRLPLQQLVDSVRVRARFEARSGGRGFAPSASIIQCLLNLPTDASCFLRALQPPPSVEHENAANIHSAAHQRCTEVISASGPSKPHKQQGEWGKTDDPKQEGGGPVSFQRKIFIVPSWA